MPVEGTPRLYSTVLVGDDLWVGTAQGVYVRAPDGRWSQPEWTPMFERPNALLQIARDDDGAYWLGSQRGLWRVQPGQIPVPVPLRSGERRGGKEGVSTCRYRWSPYH